MEESKSFAVGHFAFGHILGKASSKIAQTELNIPVVLTLSVIPDIDIILPFVEHRGPTHSIIMLSMIFVPIFTVYRRKAIPYFLALIQHPLISDYIAGGRIQLLWPITTSYYGMEMSIKSQANITIEWMVFLVSMVVMLGTRDIVRFFQPRNSNLILAIPTSTVLLPTFLSFPLDVPILLIPPHLFYTILFSTSILIDLSRILKNV